MAAHFKAGSFHCRSMEFEPKGEKQMSLEEYVKLETLGKGAMTELFDAELKRVLENIADVNTEPDATREILLRVTVAPDNNREKAEVSIQSKSKLAPHRSVSTTLYMGAARGGEMVAVEYNPKQGKLEFPLADNIEEIGGEG